MDELASRTGQRFKSSHNVDEQRSDITSGGSSSSSSSRGLEHRHRQLKPSYLHSGSCYSLAEFDSVYGAPPPAISSPVGDSPLPDRRAVLAAGSKARRRPESVDTDSSADSGIQSNLSATEADASKPRRPTESALRWNCGQQRMPILRDGSVPKHHVMNGHTAAVDTRVFDTRSPSDTGGLRQVTESTRGLNIDSDLGNGSLGQVKGYEELEKRRDSFGKNARSCGWTQPSQVGSQSLYLDVPGRRQVGPGPVRVPRRSPQMDHRDGVEPVNHDQRTREDFTKRSISNDSSEHTDHRLPAEVLTDRAPILEAHRVSVSAPGTPVHSAPSKKPSTPNLIRKQLRTITEAVVPLRRSKSSHERNARIIGSRDGTNSEVSEDEDAEERKVSKDTVASRNRQQLSSPSPLRSSVLSDTNRRTPPAATVSTTSSSAAEASASKKPKPLASRSKFWTKRFSELRSAPSSPELARKNARAKELSVDGLVAAKNPGSILELTEGEKLTLQKIAVQQLNQLGLGPITIPKGGYERRRTLKRIFQRRHGTQSLAAEANSKGGTGGGGGGGGGGDLEKERSSTRVVCWTFAIPLESCINNDVILGRLASPQSSGNARVQQEEVVTQGGNTRLLDALSLSINPGIRGGVVPDVQGLQVPYIVRTCCSHLRQHALRVKGLFRVGGLKSRVVQLRRDFDSGAKVKLTADHNPHDVASLLKEFLRDLPQCLLTRDLYQAFVLTSSLKSLNERLTALRFLVALLPVANRDTLWTLLSLLTDVVRNSKDQVTQTGLQLPGNCMDASNLAMLFGPNILHKVKRGKSQLDSMEQLNQHLEITAVVKEMINMTDSIFKLPEETHRQILQTLMEKNPDGADYILYHQGNNTGRQGNDTSHQGNGFHREILSESSRQSLDFVDSRENSFLTNSSSQLSDPMTEASRLFDLNSLFVAPIKERETQPLDRIANGHVVCHGSSSYSRQQTGGNSRLLGVAYCHQKSSEHLVDCGRHLRDLTSTPNSQKERNSGVNAFGFAGSENVTPIRHPTPETSTKIAVSRSNISQIVSCFPETENQPIVSSGAGRWEQQRWRYWEELAKKKSEELHEQQTLV